ncbi:MAG: phosphoribosylformylglycinamidine synthase [Lentisphaerae bacterium]|nr:phosphoribosylformylglycinamidine synthase [Lentisphaerota bacterium]MCP4101958.1 phosphoribosylformylglycinamidine synthase [Lentisphaerota bacterium]
MNYRIEITPLRKWRDSRGESVKKQITDFLNINVDQVWTRDVYTVSADINDEQAAAVARDLANPVLQSGTVGESLPEQNADWLVSVGFKPGVTDNVGRSAKEAVGDIIGRKLRDDEKVFSSVEYMLYGDNLAKGNVEHIARDLLANELIESVSVFTGEDAAKGIPLNIPRVTSTGSGSVNEYNLEVSDNELLEISRKGILALSLEEMKAIQNYFRGCKDREKYGLNANPTDVELEALAQTWSEHCKHKIFAAEIDYKDSETGKAEKIVSCYKSFIMKSTHEIAEEVDWLVSVFHDNAGVIAFNDKVDLVCKVETHNSPSALDPYGGAMTGIVGVNRDPMGTGQGANLLINVWGYCLGSPFTEDKDVPEGLLHPRRLRDGVHKGVIDGGNQSGIPYGLGWEYFEDRYLGKPLVYCGTVGTLPREINGIRGFEKEIKPGDLIVMAGGRIGKDGIHGATFSSEELHQDSPTQAVQIGDPITQKKMSDFIYEARSLSLYRFVTDNGAGGLSSSIGEMAELCGGCCMDLKKAPLKYAGLDPWEILVSEAQERMSFAVPPENVEEFKQLAVDRDVEITVLGEFTDSGKFHMIYGDKTVALLDIEFMHDGLPRMQLKAEWKRPVFTEPDVQDRDCGKDIAELASRLNICSDEYKARQYDHEVKGLSVIKPFVGKERDVVSDATVTMIEQLSSEGVVLSEGILPRYSDIDTYHMMASIIDLAIRRIIAVGGKLGHIAGLDNFCWPDPVQSEKTPDGEYKLAQLVRANQALYDYTKAFKVPCISGKDSMKNDSTRGGRKISIPPTVLFSAISKMDNIRKAVTLDAKFADDLVYVIGDTANELGGSEYYFMLNETGNNVPQVDSAKAISIYGAVAKVTEAELANSLHTPALGGLGVAFAKVAMGGRFGMDIDADKIPTNDELTLQQKLFSESNSRFVMTVSPDNAGKVEALLAGVPFAQVGKVVNTKSLEFRSKGAKVTNISLDAILNGYKNTLDQI